MSLRALAWAFEQEVCTSTQKFVLVALANFATESGKAFPSVDTICRLTCISKPDTVSIALSELENMQLIRDTTQRVGTTKRVKVWQLSILAREQATPEFPLLAGNSKKPEQLPGNTPHNYPTITRPAVSPNIEEPVTGNSNPVVADAPKGAVSPEDEPTADQKKEKALALKRQMTDAWCLEYELATGRKYKFCGAKDGKAADRLIAAKICVKEMIGFAKQAWARPSGFNCKYAATLAGFESRYNEIRSEIENENRRPNHRNDGVAKNGSGYGDAARRKQVGQQPPPVGQPVD